jgi:hypothetical protein
LLCPLGNEAGQLNEVIQTYESGYLNAVLVMLISCWEVETINKIINDGKLAASLCRQAAALVLDMLWNFYLVKNQKIANNSATTEATEKYAHIWNP